MNEPTEGLNFIFLPWPESLAFELTAISPVMSFAMPVSLACKQRTLSGTCYFYRIVTCAVIFEDTALRSSFSCSNTLYPLFSPKRRNLIVGTSGNYRISLFVKWHKVPMKMTTYNRWGSGLFLHCTRFILNSDQFLRVYPEKVMQMKPVQTAYAFTGNVNIFSGRDGLIVSEKRY